MAVNHARNLLLNRSGADAMASTFFGQEYVPASFVAVTLPSALVQVRQALFGQSNDLTGLNYSVWQYMRVLHSTEYVKYIYDLDPRVTYMHAAALTREPFGSVVSPAAQARFVGKTALGGGDGRLRETWSVKAEGDDYTLRNQRTGKSWIETATQSDFTPLMPLPGQSSYKVQFERTTFPGHVIISHIERPGPEMQLVARAEALARLSPEVELELFPRREPFIEFRRLWAESSLLPYKLSGVLLALIYRTEELRSDD